nr:unnamed protein product [Callosobruchus chinensis]
MLFDAEVSPALLRGEVSASMKKRHYTVEISYDFDDGIVAAKCTCPRGQAICHHMAALCIHAHHNVSVTDKTCVWSKRKTGVEADDTTKIRDIYKPKHLDYSAAQRNVTSSEIEAFKNSLSQNAPVGFSWWLLPEPSHDLMFLPNIEDIIFCDEYATAVNKHEYLIEKCSLTEETIKNVEKMTIGQSNNANWLVARKYRLTSSKFGAVIAAYKRNKYPKSLFKGLLEGYDLSGVQAIQWGKENEQTAIAKFEEVTGLCVEPAGFHLHACGFLGTSPDGYVSEKCLIEVKCPFKYRNRELLSEELSIDKHYIISFNNSSWIINETHAYYHQIQGKLHITGRDMCYLVIWIPKDVVILRIARDDEWVANMNILKSFYLEQFLPNIIS